MTKPSAALPDAPAAPAAFAAAGPVTLAAADQPGACLYNGYHLLTQLSGLYAHAAQIDPDKVGASTWGEVCDRALADLGDLFHAWEAALDAGRSGEPYLIDARDAAAVMRACRRFGQLTTLLTVWTPMTRWVRILSLGERRWARFVEAFQNASPELKAKLDAVHTGSKDRLSRLTGLAERYRQDEQRTNQALARA